MRGFLSGGSGSPAAGAKGEKAPDGPENETEQLDDAQGNVLLHMISQLKPGMDLSRITFPTFVLEPRSMLERITDFLSHPDLIFGAGQIDDPNERFVAVLRYYLAGWHIKPKGVKKPYNPVLGEIFRCRYKYKDGSRGFYIAEQVSHHPPISAFYYCSPENKLEIFGELKPKSRFLGNSAMNEMGGYNHIAFMDRPEDGEYDISMPNMYARGILFGKMVLELGDIAKVSNNNNHVHCDVDFKVKGFFSGSYNAIHGKIKAPSGEIGEISGKWSDQMYLQRGKSGKEIMFDADKATAVPKEVAPESEQEENESRRLWAKVTEAIKKNDQDAATDAKSAIEDRQREIAKQREHSGETWKPRFFTIRNDEHRPLVEIPKGSVEDQIRALEDWIFGTSSTGPASEKTPASPPAAAPQPLASAASPASPSSPPAAAYQSPSTSPTVQKSTAPAAAARLQRLLAPATPRPLQQQLAVRQPRQAPVCPGRPPPRLTTRPQLQRRMTRVQARVMA